MNPRASILASPLLRLSSFVLILLVLGSTGCSRTAPNEPAASMAGAFRSGPALLASPHGAGSYFPLQIGNRWHTSVDVHNRITFLDGSTQDTPSQADIVRVLIGTETIGGASYTVEQDSTHEQTPSEDLGSFVSWIRYRQDGAGLYEADVDPNTPPVLDGGIVARAAAHVDARGLPSRFASALTENQRAAFAAAWDKLEQRAAAIRSLRLAAKPAGVLPGEITRLAYPLHPGQEWVIRSDPDFMFTGEVEANEVVQVPAGSFPSSRIRILFAFLGSNDRVHVWFSRSGMVAFRYHIESVATDVDGNIVGTVAFDYDESLQEYALVAP